MKFVLFADVYGFSAMVKENMTLTNESLKDFHSKAERLLKKKISLSQDRYKIFYYLLSDNIFLVYDADTCSNQLDCIRCWEAFHEVCAELYQISIECDLPLRGGVAAGDLIATEKVLLGKPVIEAAEFEKNIGLPFIFIQESTLEFLYKCNFLSKEYYAKYSGNEMDIPYLKGIVSCYPILPREIETINNYALSKYKMYRTSTNTSKPAGMWLSASELLQKVMKASM